MTQPCHLNTKEPPIGGFFVQSVQKFVHSVYTSNPYKHWKNVVCSVQTHLKQF